MKGNNWGGKREGAGRKKSDVKYKTLSIVLPEEEADYLKKISEESGLTTSKFIRERLCLDVITDYKRD